MIKQAYILDITDTEKKLHEELRALAGDFCMGQKSFQTICMEVLEDWDYDKGVCFGIKYPEVEKVMDKAGVTEFILLNWW